MADFGSSRIIFVEYHRTWENLRELFNRFEIDKKQTLKNSGGIPAEFRIPDFPAYHQPFGPVAARKVTEVVQSAVGILKSAMEYPKELITDAARPGYWVPDSDIVTCNCCNAAFKESDTKHHCRACGMGVCSNCSESRRPLPSRGWDHPVRVSDQCAAKKGQL